MLSKDIDPCLLLAAHITSAGGSAHLLSIRRLRDELEKIACSDATKQAVEKILRLEPSPYSVEELIDAIPVSKRHITLQLLESLSSFSGKPESSKKTILDLTRKRWDVHATISSHESGFVNVNLDEGYQEANPTLSRSAISRVLGIFRYFLPNTFLRDLVGSLGQARGSEKLERAWHEYLLGPEYENVLRLCRRISTQDFAVSHRLYEGAAEALEALAHAVAQLAQQTEAAAVVPGATTAKAVYQNLKTTQDQLRSEVIAHLRTVQATLVKKQRSLDRFTVAFLGRTKSGKSTLHSILTNNEWDGVGFGALRTTRLAISYGWQGLRLIDTPGFGAPGGQIDEEIARSVIPEADIICLLVTSDSQQASDFQILTELKRYAKPLIIILNVKANLAHRAILDAWLADDHFLMSPSDLAQHEMRIRGYVDELSFNNHFEIVPVQLFAARLSLDTSYAPQSQILRDRSRLQKFLDVLRRMVAEEGIIRRSQTLLGSLEGEMQPITQWNSEVHHNYEELTQGLSRQLKEVVNRLESAYAAAAAQLSEGISVVFRDLQDKAAMFAEKNWDRSEEGLKQAWHKFQDESRFSVLIEERIMQAENVYRKKAESILESAFLEMKLAQSVGPLSVQLIAQDSDSSPREFLQYAAVGLGVLAVVASVIFPPAAIVASLLGTLAGIVSRFFTSRAEKRRRAVAALSETLRGQLTHREQEIRRSRSVELKKKHSEVSRVLEEYFQGLIRAADTVNKATLRAQSQITTIVYEGNRAFAKRVVDWIADRVRPLKEKNLLRVITAVEREFGRLMTIHTTMKIRPRRDRKEIARALQEEVVVKYVKKPRFISIKIWR